MAKKKVKGAKSGSAQAKSMVMQPLYRQRVAGCDKTEHKRTNRKALLRLADGGDGKPA